MSGPPLTPTLGCQIAPHYTIDYDASSSDSSSEASGDQPDGGSGEVQTGSEEREATNLEKVETEHDVAAVRTVTRPTLKARTRSSRSKQPEPPVGFFHWKMAGVRLHVLKLWLRTNLILGIAIFALLSLFWGALLWQDERSNNLEVFIVDFDGQGYNGTEHLPGNIIVDPEDVLPIVGIWITMRGAGMMTPERPRVSWVIHKPEEFGNDPLKVREAVYDFRAWAAVIVNANATDSLRAAFEFPYPNYEPADACQIIINTARDPTTVSTYILPVINYFRWGVVSQFGLERVQKLLKKYSLADLEAASPGAISPGIDCTIYDLRPFGPPIATPATSIGLIYLIIISFFSFTFFLPIHLKYLSPRGHPPLHFTHLIAWRYFATVASYFLLSFAYSLVSLVFLFPFSSSRHGSHVDPEVGVTAYGKATWVVYWMVNWLGMTALGLASENMAMILGTPWTALWLIFWVISNVCTGFYPIMLEDAFYRWGYAWPIHNVAEVTRQILFDLHPRIGLNIGVLVAWIAVDTALFPLCCFYMRWNTARVKKAAAAKDAAWQERMEKEREDPSLLARITTSQKKPA